MINIPLSRPDIDEKDIQSVVEVLKTPYLSIGPKITEFENRIADYVGREFAIGVNSGTSALSPLHKELLLLGIVIKEYMLMYLNLSGFNHFSA